MAEDVGESSLEIVGMEETGPRFSRDGRSNLERETAEDTRRRAGGYSGGGDRPNPKEVKLLEWVVRMETGLRWSVSG